MVRGAPRCVSFSPSSAASLTGWLSARKRAAQSPTTICTGVINAAIEKAGHKDVRYRLYKVTGKQSGKYEYLWESSWPSGEVYRKIHEIPAWKAVAGKHPNVNALLKDEIYNRYVEVTEKR